MSEIKGWFRKHQPASQVTEEARPAPRAERQEAGSGEQGGVEGPGAGGGDWMCATISILMRETLLAKPWEADPLDQSQQCTWSRSVHRYDALVGFTLIYSGSTWVDVFNSVFGFSGTFRGTCLKARYVQHLLFQREKQTQKKLLLKKL